MRAAALSLLTGALIASACDASEIVVERVRTDAGAAGAAAADGGSGDAEGGAVPTPSSAGVPSAGGVVGDAGAAGANGMAGAGGERLLVCNSIGSPACTGTVLLGGLPTAPVGGGARALATLGDYNHDGAADVAYADDVLGGAGVLLGIGDGTFGAPTTFPTGADARSIVRTFLNGDANEDLVVANFGSDSVSVLVGKGDGGFQPALNYDLGAGAKPTKVFAITMNNDVKTDLVVLNSGFGSVSVMLGNGDGTFNAASTTTTGIPSPSTFAVVELTGDVNDLVVGTGDGVDVLIGTGSGTFKSPPAHIALGGTPVAIASGSLNGDRFADLAITLGGSPEQALPLKVLLGHGDGTFDSPRDVAVGDSLGPVLIQGLNGDKYGSVIVGSTSATGKPGPSAYVLRGNGDGTFGAPNPLLVGRTPVAFASNDISHDGRIDVVVAYDSVAGDTSGFGIGALLGRGDGTFAVPSSTPGGVGPVDVTSGRINDDCLTDFALAASGKAVSVVLAKPGGGYAPPVDYTLPSAALKVLLGDFAGDRAVDLEVTTESGTYRLLGHGDGTFASPAALGGTGTPGDVLSADFNDDGQLDTALIAAGASGCIQLLLGGSADWSDCYAVGQAPLALAVADVDGDEKLDLVSADSGSSQLSLLLGKGDGTFQPAVPLAAGLPSTEVALGDLDGDGDTDIVTTGDDQLRLFLNAGNGTFGSAAEYPTHVYPTSHLKLADIDGDSRLDVVGTRRPANQLVVWINLGDGQLDQELAYAVGSDPYGLALGDFDRDGDTDAAIAARSANSLTLLQSVGCATWPP